MNRMNVIEIEYDEQADEMNFVCPYCGTSFVLPDAVGCKHYWFGYEGINQQPLYMCQCLRAAIEEKLMDHRTKGPESFSELWLNEYRHESDGARVSEDEYDSARTDCIEYYLESVITMDDVLWFMDRLPQFHGFRKYATMAVADDGEGNCTSYLLVDDF